MEADKSKILHHELTDLIIKSFYKVYNVLGYGFLEKVYENALKLELTNIGLNPVSQKNIKVEYLDQQVGDYFADILVNDLIIIELKAAEAICDEHEAQLINYLKATDKEVGLLLNFGKRPEFKRKIFMNQNKNLR